MAARRLPALKELSSNITRTTRGARTYAKATDVTDRAQVEALFKSTVDELGPIDFVVNCAGYVFTFSYD